MDEKGFVDSLIQTIQRAFSAATVVRPSDSHTLGIPDILGWAPVPQTFTRLTLCWSFGIEAKQLKKLLDDPMDPGRRTGQLLHHRFSGPQISMLRKMKKSGVDAFGIVRVSSDTAFCIEPEHIPAKTGNFTHEELVKVGRRVDRKDGLWSFW